MLKESSGIWTQPELRYNQGPAHISGHRNSSEPIESVTDMKRPISLTVKQEITLPQFHVPLTDFDDEIFRRISRNIINRIARQAAVAGLERFAIERSAIERSAIERYATLLDLTALQGPKHRLKCYVRLGDREFLALKNVRNGIKSTNLSSVHPRNDNVLQSVLASEVADFCGIHAEDVLYNGVIDKDILIAFFEKNIEVEEEENWERHNKSKSLTDEFDALFESSPPAPTRPVVAVKNFADENLGNLSRRVASWTIEQRKQARGGSEELQGKRLAPELEAFLQM